MAHRVTDSTGSLAGAVSSRASDAIVDELRRLIVTLQLAPGSVVTENYLMDLLKCSRTPLREALRRLAQERLLVAVPRRGVSIADLSMVEFIELTEAIDGTESFLVRLAAERISDSQLADLARIMSQAEEAEIKGDLSAEAELDFRFHHAIGEASGNRFLSEIQDTLLRLTTRFVFLGFKRLGSSAGAMSDHRRILESLQRRDPDEAEKMIREHHTNGRERIKAAL